jgi:hypothetical protein
MPKVLKISTAPTGTGGMATVVYGDAVALGEDTRTAVDAIVQTSEHSVLSISKGTVTAVASAESPDGGATYAGATTDVAFSDADRLIIRTTNASAGDANSSYDMSETNFIAINLPHTTGEPIVIQITNYSGDDPTELYGNLATVTFDAEASGGDTLVTVDAYVLAIEDELSLSTVLITSAIG